MCVALKVFLSAEDHLRRCAARTEQHRMEMLIRRFEDKVESVREQAKKIWELKEAGEYTISGTATETSRASRPDASGSGKNTKNRKEKEREARRKSEGKANATHHGAGNALADVGFKEIEGDVEMHGTDNITSLSTGDVGAQEIGPTEIDA
jgi:hypothetical protein